jgi:hypothetical protein
MHWWFCTPSCQQKLMHELIRKRLYSSFSMAYQCHQWTISERWKPTFCSHLCDIQLKYAFTWPTFTSLFNFSTAEPADSTPLPPLCMYILTYHFHTHTIVYSFVYLKYFSYLIHTYISYISGWYQHIHSISARNSELIILSVFYLLTWIWYFYLKLGI